MDDSGIVDKIVTTDLQKYHRQLRRTERDKREMREVIEEVRSGSPRGRSHELDEKFVEDALESFSIDPNDPITCGSTPDVPLSVMLMNELYHTMNKTCAKAVSSMEETRFKKLPSGFNAPFQTPVVLMDVRGLDNIAVREEREKHSGTGRGREVAFSTLGVDAATFSRLKLSEKTLLVEIVGLDRDRPVDGDDFYDEGSIPNTA